MTTPEPAPSPWQALGTVTHQFISTLQVGFNDDRPFAVAQLARLRRGAGKTVEDLPELWGETGAEGLYQVLDEHSAARVEPAMFLAVTLYATHQQSQPGRQMHKPGEELGRAVRRLMGPEIDEPIRRRFVRVGLATTTESRALRLREIVSLLRRDSIPLDYALLAQQLYQAQTRDGLRRVRQSWGRSFASYRPPTADADKDAS